MLEDMARRDTRTRFSTQRASCSVRQRSWRVSVLAGARRAYEQRDDHWMTAPEEEREAFMRAAVDWAAGGRGQPLVDAAADALVAGLDTPTLRVLAGAPHAAADEEATELAPLVFEELGISVHERLSPQAIVDGGRQLARRFLVDGDSPRALAKDLYGMYVAAGYPDELAEWSGFDDWYDMLEGGVIAGRIEDADAAVVDTARALADGRPSKHVPLDVFSGRLRSPSDGSSGCVAAAPNGPLETSSGSTWRRPTRRVTR